MLDSLPPIPDLERELRSLLEQMPDGRVTTCGALARSLGDVAASRWIGHFLLHHAHTADCNCHRVLRAGGALGGYIDGGLEGKRRRLVAEGIEFEVNGAVELERFEFLNFVSSEPLTALREWQFRHAGVKETVASPVNAHLIAGLDVSYSDERTATATCALVDEGGVLVDSRTVNLTVTMPYIPGYLAFRELPALVKLVVALQSKKMVPDLWMIDGAGLLHPRRMGIARTFGLIVRQPTIGVTKKLLCGRVEDENHNGWRPIRDGDELLGAAIPPWPQRRRPLYVSPGFGLSVEDAVRITRELLHGRRLPEPIYWADRLSRAAARATKTTVPPPVAARVE